MTEIVITKDKKLKLFDGGPITVMKSLLDCGSGDALLGTDLQGIDDLATVTKNDVTRENLLRDFISVTFFIGRASDKKASYDQVKKLVFNRFKDLVGEEITIMLTKQKTFANARDRYLLLIPTSEFCGIDIFSYGKKQIIDDFLQPVLSNLELTTYDHNYSYVKPIQSKAERYDILKSNADNSTFYIGGWKRAVEEKQKKARRRAEKKQEKELKKGKELKGLKYNANGDLVPTSIVNWKYALSHLSSKPILGRDELSANSYVINSLTESFPVGTDTETVSLKAQDQVDDDTITDLKELVEHKFSLIARSDNIVHQAVAAVARKNQFNPFLNLIRSVRWDGTKRIANLFSDYLGAPRTKANRWLSKSIFLTSLHLLIDGGTSQITFDLIGDQRTGKTTLLQKLFFSVPSNKKDSTWTLDRDEGWYTQNFDSFTKKDDLEKMTGKLIVCDDEMAVRHKMSIDESKRFASESKQDYRKSYGRTDKVYKRTYVMAATTNRPYGVYLSSFGSGKFCPILVRKRFVKKHVYSETPGESLSFETVCQMWAEALDLFRKLGNRVNGYVSLPHSIDAELEEVRESLQHTDPATMRIEDHVLESYKEYLKSVKSGAVDADEPFSITIDELIPIAKAYISGDATKKISAICCNDLGLKSALLPYAGRKTSGFVEKENSIDKLAMAQRILDSHHAQKLTRKRFSAINETPFAE